MQTDRSPEGRAHEGGGTVFGVPVKVAMVGTWIMLIAWMAFLVWTAADKI